MTCLLALDPGACTGWALFVKDFLAGCGLFHEPSEALPLIKSVGANARVVVERPRVYPKSPVPPNDVATLALRAGEWGARFAPFSAEYVYPQEWKGQIDKETCHTRMWGVLTASEHIAVDDAVAKGGRRKGKPMAPSLRHNMLDAISLGLWAVGR